MPYILVAICIFLSGTFGGYRYGKHVCQGEHATEVATIQKQAIDAANTESKAATKLAVQQIAREADSRVRAAGIRRKGEIDAEAKARPECDSDADSLRLLRESIDQANGSTEAAASRLPDALPATTNAR